MERSSQLRKLTTMGMMAAVSIILVYLIHFPIFPAASFLEYDPADIPIFICTFLYGPSIFARTYFYHFPFFSIRSLFNSSIKVFMSLNCLYTDANLT